MSLPPSPSVAIVAQDFRGHRLSYVRHIADEVIRRGTLPLLIAAPGTHGSDEYALHLSGLGSNLLTTELSEPTVSAVRAALPEGFRGPVIFPDGDLWLLPVTRTRTPWPGETRLLIMRATGQSPLAPIRVMQSAAKAALRGTARLRPRVRVFKLASAAVSELSRHEVRDPVTFAPVDGRAAALRKEWAGDAEPDEIYWFGIIGALGERKNIRLVASALASANRSTTGLALLGRAAPDEGEIETWTAGLRESRVHYFRNPAQLSDEDFDAAIAALDCVVLAHSNEGPSGIFGKARAAGTRVVAAGAKSLRRDAALAPDLATWARLTEPALKVALLDAAQSLPPVPAEPESEDFARTMIGR